jgi:hypothetical protein
MKQPREDIRGIDRSSDPLLGLDDDTLRLRDAIMGVFYHLRDAVLVGSPAPKVKAIYERIYNPRPGDLVCEVGAPTRSKWESRARGFGYLIDKRVEWSVTDDEHAREMQEGVYDEGEDRSTDTAWYVQYGPNAADVCRWVDCNFQMVPVDPKYLWNTR